MRAPRSLQGRLGLWLGVALTLLWLLAASVTALIARSEIEEVFDAACRKPRSASCHLPLSTS